MLNLSQACLAPSQHLLVLRGKDAPLLWVQEEPSHGSVL